MTGAFRRIEPTTPNPQFTPIPAREAYRGGVWPPIMPGDPIDINSAYPASMDRDPWMVNADDARVLRAEDREDEQRSRRLLIQLQLNSQFGPRADWTLPICPVHGPGCPVWSETI